MNLIEKTRALKTVPGVNPDMAIDLFADIAKFEEMLAGYQAGRIEEDVFVSSASTTAYTASVRAAPIRWSG